MVLVIGQNSVLQKTYFFQSFKHGNVNRVDKAFSSAAGKGGNVARVLTAFGVDCRLLAYIGGGNGEKFREDLQRDKISYEYAAIDGETRICTTLVVTGEGITELVEPPPRISALERKRYQQLFDSALEEANFLVISGTAISGETENCYKEYILEAKKRGIPVLLDSYKSQGKIALEASPDILKINKLEIEELTGLSFGSSEERRIVYQRVRERYGVSWVVITKGGEGVEGCDGETIYSVEIPKVKVVNSIGSGDSVTAGFILSLFEGGGVGGAKERSPELLKNALLYGAAMGTANCLNWKPGHIKRSDFEEVLEKTSISSMALCIKHN